jgi:NTP pyrophosphatase (non-canonical NTP hydrolase)
MNIIQKELEKFQLRKGWEISKENQEKSIESLLLNHMLLTTEIAEIAEELRRMMNLAYSLREEGIDKEEAFIRAKKEVAEEIGKEIADSIAYLSKFATFFERDVEKDITSKLKEIDQRQKPNQQLQMKRVTN